MSGNPYYFLELSPFTGYLKLLWKDTMIQFDIYENGPEMSGSEPSLLKKYGILLFGGRDYIFH